MVVFDGVKVLGAAVLKALYVLLVAVVYLVAGFVGTWGSILVSAIFLLLMASVMAGVTVLMLFLIDAATV